MFYRKQVQVTTSYLIYVVAEFIAGAVKHTEYDSRDDADAHLNAAENPCQVLVDSRSMVITL